MSSRLIDLKYLIDKQAEDEGLWFVAQTASEAYLQQELRRLHVVCEDVISRYIVLLNQEKQEEV